MIYFEIFNSKIVLFLTVIFLFNLLILRYKFEIARYFKINDIPNDRKIHKNPTPLIEVCAYFQV